MDFFNINTIAFTVFGYPMSYIEFIGTVSGLACVWLTVRRHISCWPIGIVNIIFFFLVFYQVRLYSDMILQAIFFILSVYGWYRWLHPRTEEEANEKNELRVTGLSGKNRMIALVLTLVAIAALGAFMKRIHLIFPSVFPEPAAFPFWDASTTVMSVYAQYLLAKKKLESWILWIAVDIICVFLYNLKGIKFISIEYFVFLIMAASGLVGWLRAYKK
jgi:nicotinamide mononucleotide transporter